MKTFISRKELIETEMNSLLFISAAVTFSEDAVLTSEFAAACVRQKFYRTYVLQFINGPSSCEGS